MATAASRVSNKNGGENREKLAKQVAQQLRNDLHMISNEARKKHPAVREVSLTRLGKLVQLTLPILSPNLLPRLYRQLNEAPCVSRTSQNRKALLFKVFRHTVCTCEPVCLSVYHAVLSATDDIIHPLLFACDSKNPRLVQLALSALQKIIQYNAIPQVLYQQLLHQQVALQGHNVMWWTREKEVGR